MNLLGRVYLEAGQIDKARQVNFAVLELGPGQPAHYGYLATGTDGHEILRANRHAYEEFYLLSRRMTDTSNSSRSQCT